LSATQGRRFIAGAADDLFERHRRDVRDGDHGLPAAGGGTNPCTRATTEGACKVQVCDLSAVDGRAAAGRGVRPRTRGGQGGRPTRGRHHLQGGQKLDTAGLTLTPGRERHVRARPPARKADLRRRRHADGRTPSAPTCPRSAEKRCRRRASVTVTAPTFDAGREDQLPARRRSGGHLDGRRRGERERQHLVDPLGP